MSIDAIRWAWTVQGLRPSQKLLLLSLADRADEQHVCWPSISRLSKDTGLDERSIYRNIKSLADRGIIAITPSSGARETNRYRLVGVEGRESAKRHPCQNVTPDTVSPVKMSPLTECHPTPDTVSGLPLTECRQTPDTVSPKPKEEPKEELKVEPKGLRGDEEDLDATPTAPPEEPAYGLPLRSKAGAKPKVFPVRREHFETWSEAYPLVNVRQELKTIKAWLVSNPAKRPASDMPRFVNSWLKGEQDKLAAQAARQARASPAPQPMSWIDRENARTTAEIEAFERQQAQAQEAQNEHHAGPA